MLKAQKRGLLQRFTPDAGKGFRPGLTTKPCRRAKHRTDARRTEHAGQDTGSAPYHSG